MRTLRRRSGLLSATLAMLVAAVAFVLAPAPRALAAGSGQSQVPDLPVITLRQGVAAAGTGLTAVPLDAEAYATNGRTMAPVRFTAEAFGATVQWDPQRPKDVVILDGATRLQLTQGSATAYINGSPVTLDVPAEVKNNRTFVPIRFVSEALKAQVFYEPETHTVVISRLGRAPTLTDLEYYTLQLINLDRLTNSLEPVAWDDTAARAGRRHAEEMARAGYFSHWGLDGQLPAYRYTQAGGTDEVAENLAKMWFEGGSDTSYPVPDFLRIVSQEDGLMHSPGHRANILNRAHTQAGVGLSAGASGSTYLAQEFVNRYGAYDPLPLQAKPGQAIRVSGTLDEGVQFFAVSLGRAGVSPMTVQQLNATGPYSEPAPFASYFTARYVTPRPVVVDGRHFQVDLAPDHLKDPGTYYVYIWATLDGGSDPVLVSGRTIAVSP
ncbi:MAG: stalk domain-containing protein [Firmicutes bacterium]|nr:stalk domain-containing protein [Bacillota bacterium]